MSSAPKAGRRQAGENRQGVDETFIQDAKHDVDHQDGQDEKGPIPSAMIEKPGPFPEKWC